MSRDLGTVLFWGAGATQKLGMLTTAQQGELLFDLSRKEASKTYDTCLEKHRDLLGTAFDSVCNLLTLLDDDVQEWTTGYRMSGFSKRQEDLLQKYIDDLGGIDGDANTRKNRARNRVIMLRLRYDWAAVMRILKLQRHDVAWSDKDEKFKPSRIYAQKVYNLIDMNVAAGTGMHIFDESSSDSAKSDFIDATRLRAAKAALVMFFNLCFAASWQNVLRNSERIDPYKKVFRWLVELRCTESQISEPTTAFSTRIVSMNFDPLFWWFMKNADAEYNEYPVCVGKEGKVLYLGEDVDHVDSVRDLKSKKGFVTDDVLPEKVVEFANRRGNFENERNLAKYQTIKIYYPHGSPNIKVCPCCGKTTLFQGNELTWDSESLFPPFFFDAQTWNAIPAENVLCASDKCSEGKKWAEGELDYVQCRHCGQGIRMCDTEMLVQSGLKAQPSWIFQRIAHNVDLEVMKARHIVLLGYSLPPDDAIWVAELQSRKQRSGENVFCSLVGFEEDRACNHWLYADEFESLLKTESHDQYASLKSAVSVFGHEFVRVNYGGFPAIITSRDDWDELLYPEGWMRRVESGARLNG